MTATTEAKGETRAESETAETKEQSKVSKKKQAKANVSESTKSGTKKSGTKKSGTKKSGTKKRGTKKSGTKKSGTKKSGTKKSGTKKSGTKKKAAKSPEAKGRALRSFPAGPFRSSLTIAEGILRVAGGDRVRRLTLLEKLNLSAASSATRMAITTSGRYGLTRGSYNADWLELTEEGRKVVDPGVEAVTRRETEFKLAIDGIEPFALLYAEYRGKRIPDRAVMKDVLSASGKVDPSMIDECIDTFIVNANDLGLIRAIAGADTLVGIEQVLELIRCDGGTFAVGAGLAQNGGASRNTGSGADWDSVCFYITPIGSDGSEERRHADAIMSSLIEPAIKELGMRVVRADQIGKAGMITTQVLEHIKRSRLTVADLSFLNPNVFYEVALRHACRLPVVQVIRAADRLPFDVNQVRTVVIDTSTPYALATHLEVLRAEIASHARSALADPSSVGNPVSIFYPGFYRD